MARKTIWDLELQVGGKSTEAEKAIRNVQSAMKNLSKAGKQFGNDFKNFAQSAGKLALGVSAGVTAATASVVTMANSFATAGDKAAKTSAQLGIGIEAYQELSYAMRRSGVSAEEFDGAIQKMSLTIRQGAAGNESMVKQLAAVGLSADKLAGMKPEQALERISDFMQKLPSDAERTRTAVALFGKTAGPKMMAAMKQGSQGLKDLGAEARKLGLIISDEQAKQSETYLDTQADLVDSFKGLKNQFIGGAIGPLTEAFNHLKNAVVDQMPAIQELGAKFGQWLGTMVQRMPEIIAKIKEFASNVWDNVNKVKDFLGGWQNVAKVLAGLAIAPTLFAGIKTVVSLFNLVSKAVALAGRAIDLFKASSIAAKMATIAQAAATKIAAAAQWVFNAAMSANPIGLIVLGVVALIAGIVALVKNFDKVKEAAAKAWEGIKNVFGAVGGFFKNVWNGVKDGAAKAWNKTKEAAGNAWEGIKSGASKVGGFLKNNWKSVAVGMVNPMAGGLKMLYDNNEKFRNAVDTCFGAIKNIAGKVWDLMPEGLQNVCLKVKDIFMGVVENIKNIWDGIKDFFTGLWSAFKEGPAAVVEYMKNAFFGLFDSIKEKFFGFINVIKEGWEKVKGFFGNVAGGVKNLFTGNKNTMPGHAEGGIFTHRHIAEIAERGAEAVVPLNNSPHGFNIWKQAGEIGGYVSRMNQQQTATASTSGTPPVMKAAAQRMSGGDTPISISFSQNITLNGSVDNETVNQISAAGKQAADEFEYRVGEALKNIMRNQRRIAFA